MKEPSYEEFMRMKDMEANMYLLMTFGTIGFCFAVQLYAWWKRIHCV